MDEIEMTRKELRNVSKPKHISSAWEPPHWTDKATGTTHIAVGSTVLPGIRLMWTLCGTKDIPAGAAQWTMDRLASAVNCPDCRKTAETEDDQ